MLTVWHSIGGVSSSTGTTSARVASGTFAITTRASLRTAAPGNTSLTAAATARCVPAQRGVCKYSVDKYSVGRATPSIALSIGEDRVRVPVRQ